MLLNYLHVNGTLELLGSIKCSVNMLYSLCLISYEYLQNTQLQTKTSSLRSLKGAAADMARYMGPTASVTNIL